MGLFQAFRRHRIVGSLGFISTSLSRSYDLTRLGQVGFLALRSSSRQSTVSRQRSNGPGWVVRGALRISQGGYVTRCNRCLLGFFASLQIFTDCGLFRSRPDQLCNCTTTTRQHTTGSSADGCTRVDIQRRGWLASNFTFEVGLVALGRRLGQCPCHGCFAGVLQRSHQASTSSIFSYVGSNLGNAQTNHITGLFCQCQLGALPDHLLTKFFRRQRSTVLGLIGLDALAVVIHGITNVGCRQRSHACFTSCTHEQLGGVLKHVLPHTRRIGENG